MPCCVQVGDASSARNEDNLDLILPNTLSGKEWGANQELRVEWTMKTRLHLVYDRVYQVLPTAPLYEGDGEAARFTLPSKTRFLT